MPFLLSQRLRRRRLIRMGVAFYILLLLRRREEERRRRQSGNGFRRRQVRGKDGNEEMGIRPATRLFSSIGSLHVSLLIENHTDET